MHILAQLSDDSLRGVITISFFAIMFVVISFLDAHAEGGWSSFAKRYRAQTRPAGKAYSLPGWTYCNVHCNARGLRVIFTDTGIYFSMLFYRRLAHPPFLIPWESVKGIKKEHGRSVLEIEDTAGKIRLDLSHELEHVLARYQKAA
jgi:hypothetical protein